MSPLLDFLVLRSSVEKAAGQPTVPADKKASWPKRVGRFLRDGLREVGLVLEAMERQKRSGRNGMSHRTPYDYPNVRGLQ